MSFLACEEGLEVRGVFFFYCREAGLHLGAGYRSDPVDWTRCLTCSHTHVLRDPRVEIIHTRWPAVFDRLICE